MRQVWLILRSATVEGKSPVSLDIFWHEGYSLMVEQWSSKS